MRNAIYGVVVLSLLTTACGTDTTQRAASGGLTGVAIGALAGGPVGALIGGAVGGVAGWATPEGAETLASNAIYKEKQYSSRALNEVGMGNSAVASGQSQSPDVAQVKRVQAELRREGLYRGPIDGIMGQDTRNALVAFQGQEGIKQTATLDRPTMARLDNSIRTAHTPDTTRSGSSSPDVPRPVNQNEEPK